LKLSETRPGLLLELGCGTGRVTIPLAEAGHPVIGLDNDPQMLAVLGQNLPPQLGPLVRLLQADLTSFHFGAAFPLILMPCNTYSTLSAQQRQAALDRIRQHLHPGGLFAASLPNPVLLKQLPRRAGAEVEEIFPHPIDSEPVQVSSAWERNRKYFSLTWHYDHLLPDGRVERTSAVARHSLASVEIYLQEMQRFGLRVVRILGDFDETPYAPDSPNLILLAQLI
jgi:SAM-dependent methyltransferase